MTNNSDRLHPHEYKSSNGDKLEKTACIIVGGGITGLITATILQRQGISVTILDKGRGIGGRVATRRVSHEDSIEGVFDYGTQYFSVQNDKFQVWVDDWLKRGVIEEWSQGFPQESLKDVTEYMRRLSPRGGITSSNGETESPLFGLAESDDLLTQTQTHNRFAYGETDGKPRYCGVKGIRGIAKHLAADLDVHTSCKVVKINYDKQWVVEAEDGEQYISEMLLLTPPVPQSLDLLDASLIVLPLDVRFALESITYESSISVLALLEKPSEIPTPGGLALENSDLVWLADNYQKGISPNGYAVTLQSTASFSEYYWDSDDAEIAYKLLTAAADYLNSAVIKYQVHRWRYSYPKTFHSQPNLALSEIPLILAGDGFVSPKIEGAVLSGIATGELISKRFKG